MKLLNVLGHFFLDIAETVIIAGVVFFIFYALIAQPHQVRGESMFPTLKTGDFILTNKLSLRFSDLKRGDIVVFKYPRNEKLDYIKRIIALPNETIEIQNNHIHIFNSKHPEGFVLDESYLPKDVKTTGRVSIQEGQKYTTKPDEYVMLGDNREQSSDSREWGFVKKNLIIGKAWVRYWPPDAMAKISN